jgi:hypothetical protein
MRSRYALLILVIAASAALAGCGAVAGLVGGAPQTVVSIANKITSLPAGQAYTFNINYQHTQGAGVTVKLTGQGTLLQNGSSAFYIAPPSPPTPNSVTVTATAANGSGVSDSDTFTITAAAGPVVSISPATFSVTGGGSPVTLNISVTQDNPSDVLTGGAGTSPDCNNGPCGVFGPFNGAPGGGNYTVQFFPARSISTTTLQQVQVLSNLANSTPGVAFVTLNAGTAACALSGEQVAFLLTGSDGLGPTALLGSITVASDGSLTGEYDLVDPAGDANKAITSGKCVAGTVTNTGTLTLTDSSATHTFNFSMRGNLAFGHIAETDGMATLAGSIQAQTTPSSFSGGSYAFGFVGDFVNEMGRVAAVGSLCSSASFNLTFLQADINSDGTIASALSGTGGFSAPDANGRSTTGSTPWSFSDGSSMDLTLYVVDNTRAFAVVTGGKTPTAAGLPRMTGQITGAPGAACPQQAGLFTNASLTTSVFAAKGVLAGGTIATEVGIITSVNSAAGTLTVTSDQNVGGTSKLNSGQVATYAISGAGRGTATTANGQGQQTQSILYPDGTGNVYFIAGSIGTVFGVAQSQGAVTTPVTGDYASGGDFIPPADDAFGTAKLATLPSTEISVDDTALTFTDLATGGSSGSYKLDANNPSRGTATLNNNTTFGDTSVVFYVVGGHRIFVMGLTTATPSLVDLRR